MRLMTQSIPPLPVAADVTQSGPSSPAARKTIEMIRDNISSTLGQIVPAGGNALYWDFTEHPNVGDSLLLLGELAWLSKNCQTLSFGTVSAPSLRRATDADDATVFLHGGGSLGDLWHRHDELRRRVVRWARGRKVVVFPQSVALRNRDRKNLRYLEATMREFSEHGNAHVMVRDSESLELLKGYDVHVELCPDMAFFLGPLPSLRSADQEALCVLSRVDSEKLPDSLSGTGRARLVDWIDPRISDQALIQIGATFLSPPRGWRAQTNAAARVYEWHALRRVVFGAELVARGKVVVSDRLHANLLALLQGTSSVAVHDAHRKIARVLGTWLPDELHPPLFDNFREGIAMGLELAEKAPARTDGVSAGQLHSHLRSLIAGWFPRT
jgi:exopolysaccharide biosynthesis predicted pyruvyltransferase EpsI